MKYLYPYEAKYYEFPKEFDYLKQVPFHPPFINVISTGEPKKDKLNYSGAKKRRWVILED